MSENDKLRLYEKIYDLCKEYYNSQEKFYDDVDLNKVYKGYLIEKELIEKLKKYILYDKIGHYISKGDNFKTLKILIEKFSNEREINKIDIKINQTQFNNVNDLKNALNNKTFYLIKQNFWNKLYPIKENFNKNREEGIEYLLNNDKIIIIIKGNELKFKNTY